MSSCNNKMPLQAITNPNKFISTFVSSLGQITPLITDRTVALDLCAQILLLCRFSSEAIGVKGRRAFLGHCCTPQTVSRCTQRAEEQKEWFSAHSPQPGKSAAPRDTQQAPRLSCRTSPGEATWLALLWKSIKVEKTAFNCTRAQGAIPLQVIRWLARCEREI